MIKADIISFVLHGLFGSYMLYNIRFGSFKSPNTPLGIEFPCGSIPFFTFFMCVCPLGPHPSYRILRRSRRFGAG